MRQNTDTYPEALVKKCCCISERGRICDVEAGLLCCYVRSGCRPQEGHRALEGALRFFSPLLKEVGISVVLSTVLKCCHLPCFQCHLRGVGEEEEGVV